MYIRTYVQDSLRVSVSDVSRVYSVLSDESDEEFDDDKIDRIVLVTQMPRKHQGGDRTPSQITKHRITSDLAHVINDGLYFYEKVLRVC